MNLSVRQLREWYVALLSLGMLVLFYLWLKQGQMDGKRVHLTAETLTHSRRKSLEIFRTLDNTTCLDLTKGHTALEESVLLAKNELQTHVLPDRAFVHLANNCSQFTSTGGYANKPVSEKERDFPLAFGILIYKSVHQFEQLLRTIYRPHNIYCIHVDSKSSSDFHEAVRAISSCFDNVFIASKLERVVWSSVSQIYAELNCHRDALKRNNKWRYFINLTGQEFPLKTNLEIVQILQTFHGQNDISNDGRLFPIRTYYRYYAYVDNMKRTRVPKTDPIPPGMVIRKGELHSAITRDFVEFLHSSEIAQRWLRWVADTKSPDEIYYQSLASLPEAPGGPGKRNVSSSVSRIKIWEKLGLPCYGIYLRGVCVFSWKDLPWLVGRPHLFANKFHVDYDALVLKCLEEEIQNRVDSPVELNLDVFTKFVEKRSWYGIGRVDRWGRLSET